MKKLSEMEKKASSKVLGDLRSHARELMNDKMKGMKKVTVASDSEEGLKKGLSKAEEILEKDDLPLDEEESETPEMDHEESAEPSEYEEAECDTPEEVDQKIKELLALKEKMLAKK